MKRIPALIALLVIISCNPSRKIRTGAAGIDNDTTAMAGAKLERKARQLFEEDRSIPFNTFSAKVRVEYEDMYGRQPETNAYLRMEKDRFIWVSITATFLNIEAARVWMTPDSIIIVNKLEKTIEAHPLRFIQETIALPLHFSDIQKLIAGKMILAGDSINAISASENFLKISSIQPGIQNEIYFTLASFLLARQAIRVAGPMEDYGAEVLYEDYEKSDIGYFSTTRQISVPAKKQKIKLGFKQYEFNKELSVPFSRPEGYTIK